MSILIKAIIALIIVFIFILGIIHFENKNFVVTHYSVDVAGDKIAKQGVSICFLSDLHNCEFGPANEKLYQAIVNENPDIIAVGGDMIVKEESSDPKAALALLTRLAKKYPIYYANGNHEKKLELMELGENSYYHNYVETLKEKGIHFITNRNEIIEVKGSKLQLTGLDLDLSYYKKLKKKVITATDLREMLPKREQGICQILLAHNPIYFDAYAAEGSDVVLSGHVHGGLVILPFLGGVLSTQLALFPKYDFGKFTKGKTTMILSRGLGSHTIKVRFNNRPEVAMVQLSSLKKPLD